MHRKDNTTTSNHTNSAGNNDFKIYMAILKTHPELRYELETMFAEMVAERSLA